MKKEKYLELFKVVCVAGNVVVLSPQS